MGPGHARYTLGLNKTGLMHEIETVPVAALLLERPFANCVCLAVAKQP